jgi:hypothetical protein
MICSAAHIASDACRLSEGSARAGAGLATFLMIMKWLTFENSPIQAIIRGEYIFRHPGHFNAEYQNCLRKTYVKKLHSQVVFSVVPAYPM